MQNALYYGDNLEVLRKFVKDETVDLCYIDPPFISKRNYNPIDNNIGGEDRAQSQAFMDTLVAAKRPSNGAWTLVNVLTAAKFDHLNQTPGVPVMYRVKAKRGNAESVPSPDTVAYADVAFLLED